VGGEGRTGSKAGRTTVSALRHHWRHSGLICCCDSVRAVTCMRRLQCGYQGVLWMVGEIRGSRNNGALVAGAAIGTTVDGLR